MIRSTMAVAAASTVAPRAAFLMVAAVALCGCGEEHRMVPDATPMRAVTVSALGFDSAGRSDEVTIEVPSGTRALTLVVRGDDEALYALAELTTADGIERVGLPGGLDLPAALETSYFEEQIGGLPGEMYQSARLGLFTHVYPNRPADLLPAGRVSLRLATSRPEGVVELTVLMPEEDGAAALPLNIFAVSNTLAYEADDAASVPWLGAAAAILAQAGLELRVERVINLPDSGLASMTEVSEPQEGPQSMSATLALLGAQVVSSDGLNVFVVDSLPPGIGGWSLGTPGPPQRGTYYSGVVIEDGIASELGRVAAHEIAHFVGLAHVINRGVSGASYPDPLDDTNPLEDNLMADGTHITSDQSFVLRRSALLQR